MQDFVHQPWCWRRAGSRGDLSGDGEDEGDDDEGAA